MPLTYHLVPAETWATSDATRPYEAASLADEGFVHCTDGVGELVATANRHLRGDPRPYRVLTLDLERVGSPWRYDDPARSIEPRSSPSGPSSATRTDGSSRSNPDRRALDRSDRLDGARSHHGRRVFAVDAERASAATCGMVDDEERDPELDPELDPREAARDRRRDRDHEAHGRSLMRTGLAKGFKQILDAQARRAERAALAEERKPKPKDKRRP
jgi:hypothetical protein